MQRSGVTFRMYTSIQPAIYTIPDHLVALSYHCAKVDAVYVVHRDTQVSTSTNHRTIKLILSSSRPESFLCRSANDSSKNLTHRYGRLDGPTARRF